MTEREPDHLFEELRRKLEDYGSHPSPDVWAGLEQHLAPQSAAPPRRRRYWLLAAACLLLLLVAGTLWLRPALLPAATDTVASSSSSSNAGQTSPPAAAPSQEVAGGAVPARSSAPATAEAAPGAARRGASLAARPSAPPAAAGTLPAAETATGRPLAAGRTRRQPGAATVATPLPDSDAQSGTTPPASDYAASPTGRKPGPGRIAATSRSRRVRPVAGVTGSMAVQTARNGQPAASGATPGRVAETSSASAARPTTPAGAAASTAVSPANGTTQLDGPVENNLVAGRSSAAVDTSKPLAGASAEPDQNPANQQANNASNPTTPTSPNHAATVAPAAAGSNQPAAIRQTAADADQAGAVSPAQAASAATTRPQGLAAAAGRLTAAPTPGTAPELLAGRRTLLQLPITALPAPLTGVPPAEPPTPAVSLPGRWSVAVLAGPALTYRLLGAAPDSTGAGLNLTERPALTYAAQLQLSFAASERLRLNGGLGYTEYATRYSAVVNVARVQTIITRQVRVFDNGTRRDSLVFEFSNDSIVGTEQKRLRLRNTYRYVTVPLQAQLRLGGTGRWAYYGLAGAALGLYVGGRTTEGGSACHCEQTRWQPGRSPFRRATALLTLGAAAEYELRPGWHLQLQPVVQQAMLSITDESRPARRPLGVSVQTGLRIDLP